MLTLLSAVKVWSVALTPKGSSGCPQDPAWVIQSSYEEVIRNVSDA